MSSRFAARLCLIVLLSLAVGRSDAGSSNSLMDITPDGSRLLVANGDNGSVTVVDTARTAWSRAARRARNPRSRRVHRAGTRWPFDRAFETSRVRDCYVGCYVGNRPATI
jgi:hypothetical protein